MNADSIDKFLRMTKAVVGMAILFVGIACFVEIWRHPAKYPSYAFSFGAPKPHPVVYIALANVLLGIGLLLPASARRWLKSRKKPQSFD